MRLTNELRERIIRNAITASGHFDRVAEADAQHYSVAEEVRVYSLVGQEVADVLADRISHIQALVDALPRGIAHFSAYERSRIDAVVAGRRHRLYFGAMINSYRPVKICTSDDIQINNAELAKRVHRVVASQENLNEEYLTLYAAVRPVVYTAKSIKQLVELWPEAAELIPKEPPQRAQLPAVRIADLNALIGLPK